jgi:hypothetical protein
MKIEKIEKFTNFLYFIDSYVVSFRSLLSKRVTDFETGLLLPEESFPSGESGPAR